MSEIEIMRRIQLVATRIGARLFRNNVGMGWTGIKANTASNNSVLLHGARPLHAGLCKGSSDLIGFYPLTITKEMVGLVLPIFLAAEIKSKSGRLSKEQESFLKMLSDFNAIAIVARSEEDFLNGIKAYIEILNTKIR